MSLKILIAAGGTGGHLFPAQQLSRQLLKEGGTKLLFAGYKLQESPFFGQEKIPFQEIPSASLKNIGSFLSASWKGFWKSVGLLRRYRPDVVVGFGSYHTFPVLLAAAFLRKKIVLFEANCVLGKVNRFFLPLAQKIGLQFPQGIKGKAGKNKGVAVPLLPWGVEGKSYSSEEARREYGLDPRLLTILVFGGSQGADFLNREFPKAAALLSGKGICFQVIHLTGKEGRASYEGVSAAAALKPFETDMSLAYAAADLVVSRSGAGTIAELIRFQIPALLIPYPFAAEDHQRINGNFLAQEVGGARMLLQREASPEKIAVEIEGLIAERSAYRSALQGAFEEAGRRSDFWDLVRETGEIRCRHTIS